MPIFSTSRVPLVPTFQLGPDNDDLGIRNPDESDELSSLYSSENRSGKVTSITTKVGSIFQNPEKKRKISLNSSPSISNLSSRLFSKMQPSTSQQPNKHSSFISMSSSSQSKYTSYRIAEQHRSLFFFKPRNPLRRLLLRVTASRAFDIIILICIFLNCISLALTKPSNTAEFANVLRVLDWIFTGIFCVEMVMKIIALGFILHPGSYLRSTWNWLDFIIVCMAFLQQLPFVNNYSALRSLRALRPLRSIRGISGLRVIVNSLLQSIPPFINVLVLLFFSFGIFGILGTQLFRGILRNRCVITGSQYTDADGASLWRLAYDDRGEEILCSLFWLGRSCPATYFGEAVHCQAYGSLENPLANTINFDHVGWAFMQIFQIYAGEEWTLIMYQVMDAWSYLAVVYFLVVMFFGALFAVNLGLAVINDKFNQVSSAADNDSDSISIRTRIVKVFKNRKESAWLIKKLAWLDYHSDEEDDSSGMESEYGDDSGTDPNSSHEDSPRSVSRQPKLQMHINTGKFTPLHNNLAGNNASPTSDDEESENPFSELPTLGFANTMSQYAVQQQQPSSDDEIRHPTLNYPAPTKGKRLRKSLRRNSFNLRRRNSMRQRPKGCCAGCLFDSYRVTRRFRRAVNHLVRNEWFTRFMLGTIVLNTLFLAVEHHNQPDWLTLVGEITNYIFTVLFTLELILKLYGLGISFFADWFNLLDFFVVGASILELSFANTTSFSVLRTFRLLRVFKLLTWKSLRKLTETILKSFRSIFYLCIIFSLFLFVMTLIGMQSFAGKLDPLGPPVQNFDDFIHATITVFQIITKENWVYIYANLMGVEHGDPLQDFTTILYMIVTIILGDFILLNLFLAILLQSFDDDVEELVPVKHSNSGRRHTARSSTKASDITKPDKLTAVRQYASSDALSSDTESHHGDGAPSAHEASPLVHPDEPSGTDQKTHKRLSEFIIGRWRKWRAFKKGASPQPENQDANHLSMLPVRSTSNVALDNVSPGSAEPPPLFTPAGRAKGETEEYFEEEEVDPMPLKGRSLCIFPPGFPLRVLLRRFFIHPMTEIFLLLCVTVSSLMLAVETPDLDTYSVLGRIVFWLGVFFAFVFTIEMLLKMFTQGIIIVSLKKENRKGYFNDPWNVLDAIIVAVSILSLAYTDSRVSAIKALRALRPLRFVNRIRGLRVVISTLFRSMTAIVNVLIICLLMFLIFAILGVELFGGKFYYCSLEHIQNEQDCLYPSGVNRTMDFVWDSRSNQCSMLPQFEETIIHRDNCTTPMLWVNHHWHFDHLPNALLVLFEVGTIENWPDISNLAVSAVGIDMQPKQDHNIFAALYFVLFVAIGAMFIVNLFVGVVLSSFNRIKEDEDGSLMLTLEQREWVATQRLFMKLKLVKKSMPPRTWWRKPVYDFVMNTKFEMSITMLILINVVFMAIEHDGMSETLSSILSYANIVFTVIFTVESVLKMIGLGLFQYFVDPWNVFDLAVVFLSIFGIVVNYTVEGIALNPTILRVVRIFRIFRILRLVKRAKRIRALLETLYYSIPSMMNVMLTVVLVAFIYSIIGMNLFYYVKPTDEMTHLVNFRGFFFSMLTMIRISTSEDWNGIMRDCMNQKNCTGDECGNPWFAIPFFVSYIIICTFVIMNLFVAVILDNFETQMKFEDSALNSEDLGRFVQIWSELDPKATYTIPTKYLKNLLQRVGPPLGLPVDCSRAELIRKLVTLDIPEHQGKIHFIETLIPLARRVYNVELPLHERRKLEKNLAHRYKSLTKMSSTFGYSTGEYFAASYIQAAFRGRQVRKAGSTTIGLELVRTNSGRLRFKVDRRCHRVVKIKEWERHLLQVQQEQREGEDQEETLYTGSEDVSSDEDGSLTTTNTTAVVSGEESDEDSLSDDSLATPPQAQGLLVQERGSRQDSPRNSPKDSEFVSRFSSMRLVLGGRAIQLDEVQQEEPEELDELVHEEGELNQVEHGEIDTQRDDTQSEEVDANNLVPDEVIDSTEQKLEEALGELDEDEAPASGTDTSRDDRV